MYTTTIGNVDKAKMMRANANANAKAKSCFYIMQNMRLLITRFDSIYKCGNTDLTFYGLFCQQVIPTCSFCELFIHLSA